MIIKKFRETMIDEMDRFIHGPESVVSPIALTPCNINSLFTLFQQGLRMCLC